MGETERIVAETQPSQQITAVTEQMPVNETKTVEETKSQARSVNELNVSHAGDTVSGSAEQTLNDVIVVANEVEKMKRVVVQETAVTAALTENVQTSSTSPEKTIAHDLNRFGKDNESDKTRSTDADSTVQVSNKGLVPSNNPDFCRLDENVSVVSKSDSSAQISNSGSDVASNIMEIKQEVVVGETERAVGTQGSQQLTETETAIAETVGQGLQQAVVLEKTSVNKNKTVEVATSQAGNGNVLNESGAGHTVSGSAQQTSNSVIVVANEIERKQVVVQETSVPEILTESAQSPASPERTSLDQQNSIEGDESDETNPEHVVTLGSVRSDQISEDTTDVESTVQPQHKGILQSKESNSEFSSHGTNVGETNSNKHSDTAEINDGKCMCADELMNDQDLCINESEKHFGNEILDLPEVRGVLDEFYEIFEDMQMAGTGNGEKGKKEPDRKDETSGGLIGTEVPSSNFDEANAIDETRGHGGNVGDVLKAKTSENNKNNATENSEEELKAKSNVKCNENTTQETVRTAKSTTDATPITQQSVVQVCSSNTSLPVHRTNVLSESKRGFD